MKLILEKPVYGGDCLTHLPETAGKGGKAVFVPLTLPGETVSVRSDGSHAAVTTSVAETVSVLADPSPPPRIALPEQLVLGRERYGR